MFHNALQLFILILSNLDQTVYIRHSFTFFIVTCVEHFPLTKILASSGLKFSSLTCLMPLSFHYALQLCCQVTPVSGRPLLTLKMAKFKSKRVKT